MTNRKRWELIATITYILIMVIIICCAVFIPKLTDGKKAGDTSHVSSSGVVTNASSTMPKDAGKEAVAWYVDLMGKLDKTDLPKNFFGDASSTEILNSFAQGDYDKMPKDVQDSFRFTEDAKALEGRLVDYPTLKASALTALIMSWQLHSTALKNDAGFKPSQDGVMVDREHAQVIFPMETVCGLPVTLTIVLDWNGKSWQVDGDTVGSQVASQVRANQLQQKYDESQSKNTGDK